MDTLFPVFLFVWKTSLTAGIITAILLLIRLLCRKFPRKVSYALWGLVLLRLAVPISLPSPASIFNFTSYTPQTSIAQDFPEAAKPGIDFSPEIPQPPQQPGTEPPPAELLPAPQSQPESAVPAPTLPETSPQPTPPREQPLPLILAAVWAGVASVLLLGGTGGYLLLRQKYRTSCLYRDQSLFERCNGMLRHPLRRRVRLDTSPYAASPLVVGILRPRIILPEEDIPDEQAVCMVLHELIHIRRGDHLLRLLSLALACIHWFNPMVWLALRLSAKDMELSCDEAALARMGQGAGATYASALLALSVRQHRPLSPLLMFGESSLKSRVKHALSYKKPALWVSIAAVLLIAGSAALFLTDPVRAPAVKDGEQMSADISGIPLSVHADTQIAALLDPNGWQKLDAIPDTGHFPILKITAGQTEFSFSQADPAAIVTENGEETGYRVPLGTEETLRARLLEASEEYRQLPEGQQEILSALICSETVWGMRDYADYFPLDSQFLSRLSAAILSSPGEVVSGMEPDPASPVQFITIHLVNPQGESQIHLWQQGGAVCLYMGEYGSAGAQLKLDATPFAGLFEEFAAIPFTGWSTDQFAGNAPGFSSLTELPAGWQAQAVGEWLVCWGQDELRVLQIPGGETLFAEKNVPLDVKQVRAGGTSLYDLEISGFAEGYPFVWGIRLGAEPVSNFYLNWPELHFPEGSLYSTDTHLTEEGAISAYYNGDSLQVAEDRPYAGEESLQVVLEDRQIRAAIAEAGLFSGEYAGLSNVTFANNGSTIVADIQMADYPFQNGTVFATREGSSWKTRILPGSPYYAEGKLDNSFFKILPDGTVACYLLEDTGWSAEQVDPVTLETIRTLSFGGYSHEYLSLEEKYPLSISGDAFYSPRVIIRLLGRDTAAVIDRSYKLGGQRLYLLDFSQSLLSEPIMLNAPLLSAAGDWAVTGSPAVTADGGLQGQAFFSAPLGSLADTLGSRELRPLPAQEETVPVQADQTLRALFNEPVFLTSRTGNFSGYSNNLYNGALHPLRWEPCAQPPELPAAPTVTARYLPGNTGIAAFNLYETAEPVILELLPLEESAAPLYYKANPNYPDFAGDLVSALESYGFPDYSLEYITGRDASLQIFQIENQMDILDAAALLQTGHRLRYDNRTASVLSLQGNTAICLVSRSDAASYPERIAEPGLLPAGAEALEVGGYSFYQSENHFLVVFTTGKPYSAVPLAEGYAQGLIGADMLAEAQQNAAEKMPRLYRDAGTFRVEQLLNTMRWINPETGKPAAMFDNQAFYRFAEWMAEYQASGEWDAWQTKLESFLHSHEEYAGFRENLPEALHVFYPGEVFRAAIQDAWGDGAEPDWDNSGNLLQYYPEEDIVETAYGIGFESSSHCYPLSLEERDGKLTVSYVQLYWYPGDRSPFVSAAQDGEDQYWLGESWPAYPTLAELRQRAAELPLQTAVFRKEDGRWVFDSPVS